MQPTTAPQATALSTAAPSTVVHSADPTYYRFDAGAVKILGSRSDTTGDLFWPPRLRCPVSGGTVTPVELACTGTVWSWTFVNAPWRGVVSPSQSDGYAAGLVDLDGGSNGSGGPRVAAVLLGDLDTWTVGDRAHARPLSFAVDDDGAVTALLAFEKVTA